MSISGQKTGTSRECGLHRGMGAGTTSQSQPAEHALANQGELNAPLAGTSIRLDPIGLKRLTFIYGHFSDKYQKM